MTRLTQALRAAAAPLLAYYTVTLAVPLANGAARSGRAFVTHAIVVLIVPPIMIGVRWVIGSIWKMITGATIRASWTGSPRDEARGTPSAAVQPRTAID